MSTSNALGEFLRARREQLRPEDAGLEVAGHRRTPGLRREEVAMLAGISTDYYLRLEQGRDRTPSVQVVEAIGRVLQLDPDEATDDPRMAALVGELSMKSDRFRRLWAQQDVVRPAGGPARMHHPEVGDLELHREKLIVAGTDGQVLVVYHTDPGTPTAQALNLLGTIAASSGSPADGGARLDGADSGRPQGT
jgi:transcriptional regulator with XRE-family HTH domain